MKLRNKKTGEVVIANVTRTISGVEFDCGVTLSELNEEWEDYEEPKKYWGIDYSSCRKGGIEEFSYDNDSIDEFNKSIGNCFSTKEEAERAVEKLKAYKRLKDKGFRFRWIDKESGNIKYAFYVDSSDEIDRFDYKDLDLLFGGEE